MRWPEEADAGAEAVARGMAVLYLVRAAAPAPVPSSPLEDWIRLPADERDLDARLAMLERRAAEHAGPPRVDADGRLHFRGKAVDLTPAEAALVARLLERPGAEVSDEELAAIVAGQVEEVPTPLRTEMTRVRARLRPLRLSVERVRGRGYRIAPALSEAAGAPGCAVGSAARAVNEGTWVVDGGSWFDG